MPLKTASISFTNLGASANPDFQSNANQTSYATASWTPPTSGLIYLFVVSAKAAYAANPAIPTVSGNGITWVQIQTAVSPVNVRMTLFGANASGSSAGATTIDFAGETQEGCSASFCSATGTDVANGVAQTFVQSPTNSGSADSTLTITLAAAGNSNNRPIAGFQHGISGGATPRTNWTEADDLTDVTTAALETQFRSDAFETTASATIGSNSNWVGIAAEIKVGTTFTPNIMLL